MKVSSEVLGWEWRATALAKVIFTRRSDLAVRDAPDRWDLLVELLAEGSGSGQVFAVELKARVRAEDFGRVGEEGEVTLDASMREVVEALARRERDTPFPVCFITFAMTSDQGYFGWIRRPVRDGLVTEQPEELLPFSDDAVAEIIGDVRAWYGGRRAHAVAG